MCPFTISLPGMLIDKVSNSLQHEDKLRRRFGRTILNMLKFISSVRLTSTPSLVAFVVMLGRNDLGGIP